MARSTEPGDRLDESFQVAAHVLLDDVKMPITMTFNLGHERIATADTGGSGHEVAASAFEVTRLRHERVHERRSLSGAG